MTWGRRIRLYLVGFGIGCLIVWFMFFRNSKRNLAGWLPSDRVTAFIASSHKLNVDSALFCRMKCNGISIDDVRRSVMKGQVDFDRSDPHKEPCHEYDVKMNVKGKDLEFYFSACVDDSTASILKIYPPLPGDSCGCN
ncbi:MAG TPA: DUF4258 domain-containing protein [Bacteroidia bacterium]|nr:DUF4258 domain-containing protein [Bacteroidia bacterium]